MTLVVTLVMTLVVTLVVTLVDPLARVYHPELAGWAYPPNMSNNKEYPHHNPHHKYQIHNRLPIHSDKYHHKCICHSCMNHPALVQFLVDSARMGLGLVYPAG